MQNVFYDEDWCAFLAQLPGESDLSEGAKRTGALTRRRNFKSAIHLLRVVLGYATDDSSLSQTAAWSTAQGIAPLSKQAVNDALRRCDEWLAELVGSVLGRRVSSGPLGCGLSVRLVDATALRVPGVRGIGYRLHVVFDPWAQRIVTAVLTDVKGGEKLGRFECQPNDLLVGDCGYAHRPGLWHVHQASAYFLVRINWQNVPLDYPNGAAFDLFSALRKLPERGVGEFEVTVRPDNETGPIPCRVVAMRRSSEAAARARKRVEQEARKKKRKPDPRTLEACDYVILLTNVPTDVLSAESLAEMYRIRWQIELEFKRLKSLAKLDTIPCKDERGIRAYLFAKLLCALLAQELAAFSPWGYRLGGCPGHRAGALPLCIPASVGNGQATKSSVHMEAV